MIKALQWAYNRGIHAERQRIKGLISQFRNQVDSENAMYSTFGDKEKRSEHNLKTIEASNRAMQILDKLLMPTENFVESAPPPIDEE
jgi:hypothetical protein